MPINYADYPDDFKKTSQRIRFERAGGKCERCQAPHGQMIARSRDGRYMLAATGETFNAETGAFLGYEKGSEFPAKKVLVVVLTVGHLDHDVTNNDENNLKALCQRCHLNHDRQDNARRRKYGKQFIAKAPTLFQ